MEAAEEKQLLERIRKKDGAAMRRLFDNCAPMLMSLANRYIPDKDDAQDVLQTSFISIFDKIDRFQYQGPGSLQAWMRRITANASISWLRRQKRLRFAALPEELSDEALQEEEPACESISQETIFNAIRSLPDGYRTVLNLYVFEDLSHKEIAALLGITEGTSASQLNRARALLWKKLKTSAQ
ncbi:MAG: sigma-70 family RNA polymerase sigma factor [Bacteroidales bacterium]|nr:sigma-70 family RNA polymerase sigma factor [Bacteroidales bacterium]